MSVLKSISNLMQLELAEETNFTALQSYSMQVWQFYLNLSEIITPYGICTNLESGSHISCSACKMQSVPLSNLEVGIQLVKVGKRRSYVHWFKDQKMLQCILQTCAINQVANITQFDVKLGMSWRGVWDIYCLVDMLTNCILRSDWLYMLHRITFSFFVCFCCLSFFLPPFFLERERERVELEDN